jgi:60 kDa SS-A/Ro ribonucleoprotein
VARIGTHLFHFAKYVEHFRGWGRGLREAVAAWYTEKEVGRLAYQAVKYQQRDGWSHRDLLRLSHPKPPSQEHDSLFHWITQGSVEDHIAPLVMGFEAAKLSESPADTARLIQEYGLTREMVRTEHLKDAGVWEALLEKMPMTAMVRNLANMTKVGLLAPMSNAVGTVVRRLDSDAVHKERVHPLQVLVALRVYQQGSGYARQQAVGFHSRGYVSPSDVPTWKPVVQVVDALDAAFYHAFDNVESTGLRWLLALDVSGSMTSPDISGMPGISPRVGSAAMALITAKAEPQYMAVGFTRSGGGYWRSNTELVNLPISPRQRLDDVISVVSDLPFGGTDCALPMIGALKNRQPVDVFVVYTDSETWAGDIHPAQALQEYRQKMGIDAKLIVVGMTSNGFSIADPTDGGMLDVVGFDTATPQIMADFARG